MGTITSFGDGVPGQPSVREMFSQIKGMLSKITEMLSKAMPPRPPPKLGEFSFWANKIKSDNPSGSNMRYFVIPKGKSKHRVYYFTSKTKPTAGSKTKSLADGCGGSFKLPYTNGHQVYVSTKNPTTVVINGRSCLKKKQTVSSRKYSLVFDTEENAKKACAELQKRCPTQRRRLTASELLARRQRRPTSAEVVLGPLLEEIQRFQ